MADNNAKLRAKKTYDKQRWNARPENEKKLIRKNMTLRHANIIATESSDARRARLDKNKSKICSVTGGNRTYYMFYYQW